MTGIEVATGELVRDGSHSVKDNVSYLIMAYRYGNKKGYHFPVGIADTQKRAIKMATGHRIFRGGKYSHVVFELPLNQEFDAGEATIIADNCADWNEGEKR